VAEGARSAADLRREADAHYDAGRWREAADAFERALALEPRQADAWYRLGNARQELGDERGALACFEKTVDLEPAHAKAWNNVGVSREKLGEDAPAEAAYRRALEHDARLLPALRNLAQLCLRLGRTGEADDAHRKAMEIVSPSVLPHIKAAEAALASADYAAAERDLSAALELMPGHPILGHMLAAVRGEKSARASPAYVSAMFDEFAGRFDEELRSLGYHSPRRIAGLVGPTLAARAPAQVVDLGCGTGLVGAELAPLGAHLVGIDLSEKMLERAAQTGAYARLVRGDIVEELERIDARSLDAVLAADVFVYLGDLEAIFAAATRSLSPGGVFAFTVEILADGDFALLPSGRYAHSAAYLRRLAAGGRLLERSLDRIDLRRERERAIAGWLACFSAPALGS
jgi:predicted TPR repeat methyltransferase